MSPSYKVKSEMSTNQSNANNNLNTIDEYKVWQDMSTFLPLLSYGEESIELLNSLLCLPFGKMANGAQDKVGNTSSLDCNMSSAQDVHKRKEASLSNLGRALHNMLHVRGIMRKRGSGNMQHQKQAVATKSTPSKKKQRIVKEEKTSQSPAKSNTAAVANKKDVDILPWNVLLRITIRMTSHVVNQLNKSNTSAAAGNKQKDDDKAKEEKELIYIPYCKCWI